MCNTYRQSTKCSQVGLGFHTMKIRQRLKCFKAPSSEDVLWALTVPSLQISDHPGPATA